MGSEELKWVKDQKQFTKPGSFKKWILDVASVISKNSINLKIRVENGIKQYKHSIHCYKFCHYKAFQAFSIEYSFTISVKSLL